LQPTVVVIGGGYGGITAAKALDDVARVLLVERKDAFVHNIGALRALVDPTWLPRIFFPYERLLQNGRVVRGRAARVDGKRVALASGVELVADFVVLATGSAYPFPAKSDVDDTGAAHDKFLATHGALAAARRVLLVGAGPVGMELAGEITAAWPDKRVTVVDAADDILNGPYKPQLRAEVRAQLANRGVEFVLGAPLSEPPPVASGIGATFTVATTAGVEMTADVWLRCYGVSPVTDYLANGLADARTADGLLEVTPQLQVAGHDAVFALGDITAIREPKMAARALRHADVIAANIRAVIAGGGDMTSYEPIPPVLLIPLGPEGGASQLPGMDDIAGPDVTSQYKGRDLLVDRFADTFGLTQARA
jgi:NADH dehydrogenase FAD-containing subunit